MLITHTIRPSVNLQSGEIRLEEINSPHDLFDARGLLKQHAVAVMQTRDQAIRDCLIKLGWTPPPEPPPMGRARAAGAEAGVGCLAKAERVSDFDGKAAGEFMARHLRLHGPTSSELLVEVCRIAGYKPHDDRAFGPVFARLAREGRIRQVGACRRERGNGTSGGRIWALSRAE